MKVLIVLALVAAASAVPMQVYMAEKVRVVELPSSAPAQSDVVERVQMIENPIFDSEPVANDDLLAVKIVEAPVQRMSVHSIELPAAPVPPVYMQASEPESLLFAPIDEPVATFEQVRIVESPADELMNVEVSAPEAIKIVEAPVEHFQNVAPSELESIRVVRPSPMDMAREAVQVVV